MKGLRGVPVWAWVLLVFGGVAAFYYGRKHGSAQGSELDTTGLADAAPAPQFPGYVGYGANSGSNPGELMVPSGTPATNAKPVPPTPTPTPTPKPHPVVIPPQGGQGGVILVPPPHPLPLAAGAVGAS